MGKREREGSGKDAAKKKKRKAEGKGPSVKSLLKKHAFLELVSGEFGDKVKCTLTGHEVKPVVELVQKHLSSKKLKRAREGWFRDDWAEKYLPYVVPHKTNPKKMWCTVTSHALNKIPAEVESHVTGKKYKKKLEELLEAKKKKEEKEKRRKEKELRRKNKTHSKNEEADSNESGSSDSDSGSSSASEQDDDSDE